MADLRIRELRLSFPSQACRTERAEAVARLTLAAIRTAVAGRRWARTVVDTLVVPPIDVSFSTTSDEDIARVGAAAIASALRGAAED